MASELSRQKAAQAWCTPKTSNKVMDTDLAEAFAEILDATEYDVETWKTARLSCEEQLQEAMKIIHRCTCQNTGS